jgi:hypothetical protein
MAAVAVKDFQCGLCGDIWSRFMGFEAGCRGPSLIRKRLPLGPHGKPMRRALAWSLGRGAISEGGRLRGTPVHNPAPWSATRRESFGTRLNGEK